ncbi:40S ribosomal protein S4-3 [Zea mays]|uniref:40S ribosomal protein S4-3 n=2 Tax=Zea mays TaxID=4577 RepID=A0A1D6EML4_MAIZE|nr:40S ribosomal protein S4-3 [Zea mays]ONM21105.1 40S ribosomal protein S4-3 [Zea mays]ONM21108.1 40S ribosomal protein S4-3 [Zea mays]
MARGLKKHLKRLNAPKHWMLDKLGGAFFMLCKVRSVQFGLKGIPYLNTYDDRTIRYPDPLIKANDTIKIDLETNKIMDFIKFDVGNVVMVTGGRNTGRVGVIKNREKHKGSFETIHVLLGAFLLCLVFSYLLYRKT